MKLFIPLIAASLLFSCTSKSQNTQTADTMATDSLTSFYDLKITSLDEQSTLDMSDYKGKKVLLVNVASKCGYTYQYEGLQKLHEQYGDSLQIIGFPCNQFLFQEPGNKDSIASFCSRNYGVTFPLSTKIKVEGSGKHEIYKWLTKKSRNGVGDYSVSWNFNKFLIDEEGKLVGYFGSNVKPLDAELTSAIEQ